MNTIIQATADFLKSNKLEPATSEDGEKLLVRCCGEHLFWTTAVDTAKDNAIITMLCRLAAKVPPPKRAACARLLTRLNYGKRQGAFHLDNRDGEVLFCISNYLSAGIVSEEILDSMLSTIYCAMDDCGPKIFNLVYGQPRAAAKEPVKLSPDRNRNVTPPGLEN